MTATRRAQEWNWDGHLSGAIPPRSVPGPGGGCETAGCGYDAPVLDDPARRGWVLVQVNGSAIPARWYCSGGCAQRGIALAELRMTPDSSGGP